MPGPKRKPNILQINLGDPGKRAKARQKKAPKPSAGRITCPAALGAPARREWARVMAEFGRMEAKGQRLITQLDRSLLATYCQAWEDWLDALKHIKENGKTYAIYGAKGQVVSVRKNPYVEIQREAFQQIKACAAEFGFSPAARARIEAEDISGDDPLSKFVEGRPTAKQA